MHLKRQKVPKNWPIKRKGTKYVVRAKFNLRQGVPILIILRDLMGVARTRKEVKKIIHQKYLLVNNKPVKKEKNAVSLFDVITFVPSKKHYRVGLSEKGVFNTMDVSEKESNQKISKVINKKVLKGKKIQLNLSDGRNFLSDISCKTNDSVLINLKENKIEKCISLKKEKNAIVFAGKHSGRTGLIKKVDLEKKMVELEAEKKLIHVLIKHIMVVE